MATKYHICSNSCLLEVLLQYAHVMAIVVVDARENLQQSHQIQSRCSRDDPKDCSISLHRVQHYKSEMFLFISRKKNKISEIFFYVKNQFHEFFHISDCHLARVVQAAHLLMARKNTAEDIASLSSICFKLNR